MSKDIIVIGGGLAGLISAIQLRKAGFSVVLIERKAYPFQRVCGEYISNEVKPFLIQNDLYPTELNPSNIDKFLLTSINGKTAELNLEMGAFGISRYVYDHYLYTIGQSLGIEFLLETSVTECTFRDDGFDIKTTKTDLLRARYVIGAFGKRSTLDRKLERPFMTKKSPYIGVKYHIKTSFPDDLIALHNFEGGYCGICKIEDDKYNLCYLSERQNLKAYGNIPEMEASILWKNPHLKDIFLNSDFINEKAEVINEISFAKKSPVVNRILMVGDAAGLITPLCGNGMAMAIHGAKLLSDIMIKFDLKDRASIEQEHVRIWESMFRTRLWAGRNIQRMFGSKMLSDISVGIAQKIKPLASFLVEATHGKEF